MNAQLREKLVQLGLTEDIITSVEKLGVKEEAHLRHVTVEDLKEVGVPVVIARMLLAPYQETTTPAAPAADPNLTAVLDKMQSGNQALVQAMIDAQSSKDSVVCANCKNLIPKEYGGEFCPYCSAPMDTGIHECGICGTEVPKMIKGAKFCVNPECGAPLWDGEKGDALAALVSQGDSVRAAAEAVAEETVGSAEWLRWVRQGKKVKRPVLRTTTRSREEVQAMTPDSFRRRSSFNVDVKW